MAARFPRRARRSRSAGRQGESCGLSGSSLAGSKAGVAEPERAPETSFDPLWFSYFPSKPPSEGTVTGSVGAVPAAAGGTVGVSTKPITLWTAFGCATVAPSVCWTFSTTVWMACWRAGLRSASGTCAASGPAMPSAFICSKCWSRTSCTFNGLRGVEREDVLQEPRVERGGFGGERFHARGIGDDRRQAARFGDGAELAGKLRREAGGRQIVQWRESGPAKLGGGNERDGLCGRERHDEALGRDAAPTRGTVRGGPAGPGRGQRNIAPVGACDSGTCGWRGGSFAGAGRNGRRPPGRSRIAQLPGVETAATRASAGVRLLDLPPDRSADRRRERAAMGSFVEESSVAEHRRGAAAGRHRERRLGEAGGNRMRALHGHGRGERRNRGDGESALAQRPAEPLERAGNPLPHRGFIGAEHRRHFRVRKVLKIMEHDHFAVGPGEEIHAPRRAPPAGPRRVPAPPRPVPSRPKSAPAAPAGGFRPRPPSPPDTPRPDGATRRSKSPLEQVAGLPRQRRKDLLRHVARQLEIVGLPKRRAEHHALVALHQGVKSRLAPVVLILAEQLRIRNGGSGSHRGGHEKISFASARALYLSA